MKKEWEFMKQGLNLWETATRKRVYHWNLITYIHIPTYKISMKFKLNGTLAWTGKKNGEIEKRAEKINPKRKKEGRSLS